VTIATRIGELTVTVPSQTPLDAYQVTPVPLGDVWLYKVELRIPPGHNGVTSVLVVNNDIAIMPWGNPPTWIVDSDRTLEFPVDTEVDTQLAVWAANLGAYNHEFYFRFFYTPMTLISAPSSQPQIVPV
jgi:hypothetical protein